MRFHVDANRRMALSSKIWVRITIWRVSIGIECIHPRWTRFYLELFSKHKGKIIPFKMAIGL